MLNEKPAIVVAGYNRVHNLKRLLKALEGSYYEDNDITLVISVDYGGPKEILELAERAEWTHGPKVVRTFKENQGLRNHILACMDYSLEYGSAIIFEDDIFPAPYFYTYTQSALAFYKNDRNVFAIALYSQLWNGYVNRAFEPIQRGKDAYMLQVAGTWGECIIGDRWKEFKIWYEQNKENLKYRTDVPGVIFSWKESYAKFLNCYCAEKGMFFVTPYNSLTTNFHSVGTHSACAIPTYQVSLNIGNKQYDFASYNEAIKYDSLFENIELKKYLEDKMNGTVCIDFYGLRRNIEEYDFCLSSALLPYEVEKTYGLDLRPYELNVLYDIQGKDIFIYNTKKKNKSKRNWPHHFQLVKYEVKDLSWQDGLFYTMYIWIEKIKKLFIK